jgi:tetratricopeptide (TPR) repeat protein
MSNFTCNTPTCAISLSNAAFPVQMNCPVCQQELTEAMEKPLLSQEEEHLISNSPYVIAYPLKRALTEKHPWTKINLLKDTFLNYLKYLGLITASEFFNSDLKDKKMVALFHATLAEPSFGTWNLYIRETIAYLNQNNHLFFCPELPGYFEAIETGKKRKLYKGEIEFIDSNGDVQLKKQEATAIGMLINFRNRYLGHGLTLDEDASKKLWDEYYPMFNQLLTQLNFPIEYPMFKHEHGETYLLQSNELITVEKGNQSSASVWMENPSGQAMDILPFFIVPGELALTKEDKEQLLTYESYTGKTIKFFSPEGTEKQTSGKILEKLNLLLRDKQKEQPYTPESFTKEIFLQRIADENKLTLDTLIAEKKYIPGVYVHREEMEIKLREWIGARANIFFIAAEAGSGKTNLLVEMERQYTERELPSLLIRAGRMEKQSLKEQIAYLLNIDLLQGLVNYVSISGTQAQPTFILIDGLNEASNAEEIWREIIEISKIFIPGGIKFVVTNRANSAAEINRYHITEEQESFLYGTNKDNVNQLSAYAHWLTSLSMEEIKLAWDYFVKNDKNKFKPLFSFDELATFDRALYNQISNPLVLRLFLEIYHGKNLPKKGNQYLDIWTDWLLTFSQPEQEFLTTLANSIWEKGENELLLDDLLKNNILQHYFTSDQLNAPYPRLRNLGWVSRYVKDLNVCVGFTVEGALLHLLGKKLKKQQPLIALAEIIQLLKTGNKLKQAGVGSYLQHLALNRDLKTVCDLIDEGEEFIEICVTPIILYLKFFGVKETLDILFQNTSENDWKILWRVVLQLEEMCEFDILVNFCDCIKHYNSLKTEESLLIALKTIENLQGNQSKKYWNEIKATIESKKLNHELLSELGKIHVKNKEYSEALMVYKKCLEIREAIFQGPNTLVSKSMHNIGVVYNYLNDHHESLHWKMESYKMNLKIFREESSEVAFSLNGLGVTYSRLGDFTNAKSCYLKSLEINKKLTGENTYYVSGILSNLGYIYSETGETDTAKEYYYLAFTIAKKIFVAIDYRSQNFIYRYAKFLSENDWNDEAIYYFNQLLEIENESHKREIKNLIYLSQIGECHLANKNFTVAITFFKDALEFGQDGKTLLSLAISQENLGQLNESLISFIKSAEHRRDNLPDGIINEKTKQSVQNVIRIAKILGKENELPEWIKITTNENN